MPRRNRATYLALAGLILTACPKSEPEPAELATGATVLVRSVVKGDELIVDEGGKSARLRLLGLHAFDEVMEDAALARVAKSSVEQLTRDVVGKTVVVTLTDKAQDRYGRYLAYVDVEGRDLARSLIEGGVSVVYTEYLFDRLPAYLEAESEARAAKKGLWADPQLVRMAGGLRRQWLEARGGGGPDDPLLSWASPAEPAADAEEELPASE